MGKGWVKWTKNVINLLKCLNESLFSDYYRTYFLLITLVIISLKLVKNAIM